MEETCWEPAARSGGWVIIIKLHSERVISTFPVSLQKNKCSALEKISLLSYTAWTRGSRAHKSVVKEYCGTTLFTHKELKKYQIRISYRLTMLHFIHQVSVSNFIGVLREKFNSVPTGWGSIFSFSSTKDSMYGLMHPYSTKDHQQW